MNKWDIVTTVIQVRGEVVTGVISAATRSEAHQGVEDLLHQWEASGSPSERYAFVTPRGMYRVNDLIPHEDD